MLWRTIATLAGCLVHLSCTQEDPVPPGSATLGSVMCSVCLDRPFCARMGPEGPEYLTDRASADVVCPSGASWMEAVEARRVENFVDRSAPFFCLPVDGKSTSIPPRLLEPWALENYCPADHARFEHIDLCIDAPVECRPASCTGADLPDDAVACPPQLRLDGRRAGCGANVNGETGIGKAEAVQNLVEGAARYGEDVPTSVPARYCYLSCFDRAFAACNPDHFDLDE